MDIQFLSTAEFQTDKSALEGARLSVKTAKTNEAARTAAESFEAMFIAQMLKPIFETVPTDGLMGGGHAERMFRSLQIEEMGKEMVRSGGFGIADSVMREILAAQEV